MFRYIFRRLLQFVPVFFGVTLVLFLITTVLPGDPVRLRAGEKSMSPAVEAALRAQYGFDKPWYVQYGNYLNALAHGDLGVSIATGRPVADIIKTTYPYTVKLALSAIVVEIIVGIGVGIIAAVKRYSIWDILATLSTSVLVALPVFWLGIMLQYVFGIWLQKQTGGMFYLPVTGAGGGADGFPAWVHLVLPAITLASVSTAYAARIMRSQLLEVNGQDYIRTAHAKGLAPGAVLRKHALKNALIPVVTFIGLDLGAMLSGAVLTETVFNWPGIGFTISRAAFQLDYPTIFGCTVVILFAVMIVNLLVDISYAFLDPRIRYGGSAGE
ncbi:MAG: ABC transporter permease [Coriobacteriia bacterium]|nr:ABC transporter permease [Coriobacteriia bacterium]